MEAKLELKSATNQTKLRFYDGYVEVAKFKTSLFGNKEKDTWTAKIPYGNISRMEHSEYMGTKEFSSREHGFTDVTLHLNTYVPGINTTELTLTFDVMYSISNGVRCGGIGDESDCRTVGAKLDEIAALVG